MTNAFSIYRDLPVELQTKIAEYLKPEDIKKPLAQIISKDVIEDYHQKLERNAPEDFTERMIYYTSIGYKPGIKLSLRSSIPGKIRLLDEGLLEILLPLVGKRGDSPLLQLLIEHGAVYIDSALVSGVLHYQNSFVRKYLDFPIAEIEKLLEAAAESDNLEMAREIAPRCSEFYYGNLRTNRTSFWLCRFFGSNISDNRRYRAGFGPSADPNWGMVGDALLSDLIQPLPFTYEMIEQYRYNGYEEYARSHVNALLEGDTHNYTRLVWLLHAVSRRERRLTEDAIRSLQVSLDGELDPVSRAGQTRHIEILRTNLQTGHLLVGALEDVWIDILLPLLSIPAASSVIEAADTFLSDGWDAYTSPITSQQQLSRILHTSYPGSRYVGGYMPIQPEAMNAWLEQRLANRDPDGRETRWDESINRGIKFIVTNYPRPPGAVSSNGTPEVKKSYPSVNFDEMIERFFQARPLQTLFFILKCGLTQLWDKYYDRFEPHEIQTVEGMIEYRHLLRGAVEGGYNEIANIFLESFREENLEPTPRETIDFFAKYPRLSRLFDVKEFIAVRSFDKKLLERVTKTDEYLAQREEFVAERIRNLPS